MFVLKSDMVVYCDIDQTLIDWEVRDGDNYITIENNDRVGRFVPITENIEQVKKHAICGHKIIFWSAGGWEWCSVVVNTLGLDQYASAILSKPRWFIDDLSSDNFMPESNRINKSKR